jgi:hypothetical protein
MIFIINIVSMSPKRNNKLLDNQTSEIIHDIELGESDTGKGANQIGSLQKLGDNGYDSHCRSFFSLLKNVWCCSTIPKRCRK